MLPALLVYPNRTKDFMMECFERRRLARDVLEASQKLQNLLELESRLIALDELPHLQNSEAALVQMMERYTAVVKAYQLHVEEHGCAVHASGA